MTDSSTESPLIERESEREAVKADEGDHLRHIICVACYPAFEGSREAPHDAVCICGKPVRKGDRRNPTDTAQCILCNELWNHHSSTVHARG